MFGFHRNVKAVILERHKFSCKSLKLFELKGRFKQSKTINTHLQHHLYALNMPSVIDHLPPCSRGQSCCRWRWRGSSRDHEGSPEWGTRHASCPVSWMSWLSSHRTLVRSSPHLGRKPHPGSGNVPDQLCPKSAHTQRNCIVRTHKTVVKLKCDVKFRPLMKKTQIMARMWK